MEQREQLSDMSEYGVSWLAGRKSASNVTSTSSSGNTEKNAQNAIIAAKFAD